MKYFGYNYTVKLFIVYQNSDLPVFYLYLKNLATLYKHLYLLTTRLRAPAIFLLSET